MGYCQIILPLYIFILSTYIIRKHDNSFIPREGRKLMGKTFLVPAVLGAILLNAGMVLPEVPEGSAWTVSHGYDRCIKLFNETTAVVIEPNCGGRVIEYSLNGRNVLYTDPAQNGWTYTPGEKAINPCAGRFDIGPEMLAPRHPDLWVGRWTPEITSTGGARLTSLDDRATGVRLVRDFELDRDTSRLLITQTIINISDSTKQYFHWSRTLAVGGGICLVPLTAGSRFPRGYILYGPGTVMNYRPEDYPSIRTRGSFLEIYPNPPQPKFGIDSYAGWFGYLMPGDLLFIKKFPVYRDRVYGELAAFTISMWYYKDEMCELEPIGPRETLAPGESASFTEEWWLVPYRFPAEGAEVELTDFERFVKDTIR